MSRILKRLVVGCATALAVLLLAAPAAAAVKGDFDGDGFADFAAGAPQEAVGSIGAAGAFNVIYGSATGLSAAGNQIFSQGDGNLLGTPESGDAVGWALAAGNFDGDAFADLAVGAPGEAIGPLSGAGAVNVIYGSAAGLTGVGDRLFVQGQNGVEGTAEAVDGFGEALTASDLDGDGFDDLAVGAPGEDVTTGSGTLGDAGAVNVIYGSGSGLQAADDIILTQGQGGIEGTTEGSDRFGASLASGNFGKGAPSDLAVGAPDEDVGAIRDAGSVNVVYGAATSGLTASGDQIFSQGQGGLTGMTERGDRFGSALAAGDFGKEGSFDLAVGVPEEAIGTRDDAGAVAVIYGSATGLTAIGNQGWVQSQGGLAGTAEVGDRFGAALAAADLGQGNAHDLAVGAPDEDIGTIQDAGAVAAIYGSTSGLTAASNQLFGQGEQGIAGTTEEADGFASALAAGSFGKSAKADLAAGAPFEDVGSLDDAGAVNVVYGSATGLSGSGDQLFNQGGGGLAGTAEEFDLFGFGVAP